MSKQLLAYELQKLKQQVHSVDQERKALRVCVAAPYPHPCPWGGNGPLSVTCTIPSELGSPQTPDIQTQPPNEPAKHRAHTAAGDWFVCSFG